MNKLIFSCLLTCMLSGVSVVRAAVYSGGCGPNNNDMSVQWSLDTNDSILYITGNGPMNDYTYDTRAPWNPYRYSIRQVVFAPTVTRSGNYAFYEHTTLDSVSFGGVKSVGQNGYQYCYELKSAYIPEA